MPGRFSAVSAGEFDADPREVCGLAATSQFAAGSGSQALDERLLNLRMATSVGGDVAHAAEHGRPNWPPTQLPKPVKVAIAVPFTTSRPGPFSR